MKTKYPFPLERREARYRLTVYRLRLIVHKILQVWRRVWLDFAA